MTDPDENAEISDEEFDGNEIEELEDDFGDEIADAEINDDGIDDDGIDDDGIDDAEYDDDPDEEEDEAEDAGSGPARNPNMADDEDAEGEDIDPDNVEADLDTILKDRLAAGDDEDEDEEAPEPTPDASGQVAPKRDDEWTCEGCFLIVSSSQFGPRANPQCPSGEEPCPSLARL